MKIKSVYLLGICVFLFSATSFAATVRMKNGDAFKGRILKEELNVYVQILLQDGNEKRLTWDDIQTIEQPPELTENENTRPAPLHEPEEGTRVEFDATAFSYDSLWSSVQFQDASGAPVGASVNTTTRSLLTAPEDFGLKVFISRWRLGLRLFNNAVINGNAVDEQGFSTADISFAVSKYLRTGLFFSLNRTTQSQSSTTNIAQDYVFGPYVAAEIPLSDHIKVEFSGGLGPSFQTLTVNTGSNYLSASGTAFAALASLYGNFSITDKFSFLVGLDGWVENATPGGGITTGGTSTVGNINYNSYRLRVVPLGIRLRI